MRKKLFFNILGILLIASIIYIVSPKKGSFYNVILKQYKKAELTEVSINNAPSESNYKKVYCTDKNTLDKIVEYLKKLRIVEIKDKKYSTLRDSYCIDLYLKKDDGSNIFNYTVSIQLYDNNLEIINVNDKYGFKNYKIVNGKFNLQYIKNLIENKQ